MNWLGWLLDWLAELAVTQAHEDQIKKISPDAQVLPGTEVRVELTSGYSVDMEEKNRRKTIVGYCRQQLGKNYHLGVEHDNPISPAEWDCSELVEKAYELANMSIPDGARYQFEATQAVPKPEPGDLGFLWSDVRRMIGHVMVYTGEGTAVHAVGGRGVVEDPISGWEKHPRWKGWRRHVHFARAPHERIS